MAKDKHPKDNGGTQLAVIDPPPSLLSTATETDEVAGAFGTAMTGQQRNELPSLPLIRIDHQERVFTFNGEAMEYVEGYPVHWFQSRAWWEGGYTPGQHSPPDCWSPDMVTSSPSSPKRQDEHCADCKLAEFGSATMGKGQACKTQTFLFLVNPTFGGVSIAALLLPPSSIRSVIGGARSVGFLQMAKGFADPETGRKAKYHELVWSRFNLNRVQGAIHCVIQPEGRRVCQNADEARALASLRGSFMTAMESLRGQTPTVAAGDDE